jgi:5-methylcytosine-specific restriction enzyme A
MPARTPYQRPTQGIATAKPIRDPGSPPPPPRPCETTEERREAKRFYKSPRWRRLRAYVLAQRPLCQQCQAAGRITPAHHVHHTTPRRQRPEQALDQANLEALCQACHNTRRGADLAAVDSIGRRPRA